MALAGDAALRRTALGGDGMLPLPTVSVVLSSMRADHIEQCLSYLAGQTYPALEVLVGLHGYDVPELTRERWDALLPGPVRVSSFPAELPFGAVLGRLSRFADGELLTKVDDDDHYGPNHVTDLVIAWHTSGADVAAKGSRFVHLPERDETIDRAWAAPELFNVSPAGGTLLLARSTLQQLGGWSHSSRHVDTDLLTRVKDAGGLVYRTHALEYVYVRRATGHTWQTGTEQILAQGERTYPGLPAELIHPDYSTAGQ
jgi:cellulose synthase/poly-beta-1,6-N-acetylglucosamine synthase-like glycosyltransferase